MKIKNTLMPVLTTIIALLTVNIAHANNGGFTFPPANAMSSHQYPPQAPVAPRFNRMPTSPAPYVFGQNSPQQQRMIPSPAQAQNFVRAPAQPMSMANRSLPPFSPLNFGNNNTGNNTANNFPFSNTNMMPFGNSGNFGNMGNFSNLGNNGFNPFSKGSMPFSNNSGGMMPSNPMNNMFGNNQNWNMPFLNSGNNNRKKAWGDKRNIWPDFYTDFTDEAWDSMMSGPRDLGRMPGGWRFPYISMPDPVTVSDAIINQFPPIVEEAGNMADFSDWGIFDNN